MFTSSYARVITRRRTTHPKALSAEGRSSATRFSFHTFREFMTAHALHLPTTFARSTGLGRFDAGYTAPVGAVGSRARMRGLCVSGLAQLRDRIQPQVMAQGVSEGKPMSGRRPESIDGAGTASGGRTR